MVRSIGAGIALALTFASPAFADDFPWAVSGRGNHACIVENALVLRPDQSRLQEAVSRWTSPKSFMLEVHICSLSHIEASDACDKAPDDNSFSWVIKTPRLYGELHPGWKVTGKDFFSSELAETFFLYAGGRFDYAQLNTIAPSGHLAWFTMTGTCTPFQ